MQNGPDAVTLALTGQLPFILIAAAILALPISLFLLRLYRRAVLGSMRARAGPPARDGAPPAEPDGPTTAAGGGPALHIELLEPGSPPGMGTRAAALFELASKEPWRAAAVYGAAGLAFAAVMAAAFLASTGTGFLPLRFLMLFWVYAWPIVFAVHQVAPSARRATLTAVIVYALVLATIGAVALARSPELTWGQIAILWAATNLVPTLLLVAFLNRRVRAVGPLVLTVMVLSLTGAALALSVAGGSEGLLRWIAGVAVRLGLGAVATFIAIAAVGFVVFAVLGWLAAVWIGRGYQAKKINDQSITLDAVWLLFGIVYSVGLVFEGAGWILAGIVAFAVYELAVRAGFKLTRSGDARTPSPFTLLLLRVFSLGRASERMFDSVTRNWRHIGNVELIAGPDLATSTVEPHEFLSFLSGRVSRLFIDGEATLQAKIAEIDTRPDFDGRFRVDDFFCHDDTWRMVLSRLLDRSDAVLMDLRGFTPENAGVVFELNELVRTARLENVVLVIDGTTDRAFLDRTLQDAWARAGGAQRASGNGTVRLFRYDADRSSAATAVLRWLCAAAQRGEALRRVG